MTSEPYDLDALTTKVPVKVGGVVYELDPGAIPLVLKIRIENFVAGISDRKDADTQAVESESAELCARALQVDQEVTQAFGPLPRLHLLRFLATGARPPRTSSNP